MTTKLGYADAMVAGGVYTSGEAISACLQAIGLQKNISVAVTSTFLYLPDIAIRRAMPRPVFIVKQTASK